MYRTFVVFFLLTICISNCNTDAPPTAMPTLTKEQQLQQNLATLKETAVSGDLIVRLSDDILSQQITNMNEKDKSYSHGGIVVQQNGRTYVYHIAPGLPGQDTIQMEPIDSFINPEKNIRCALFRYQLSDAERNLLMQAIRKDKENNTRFDMVYDLATNDKMYCSEMISKALTQATNGRMQFKTVNAPKQMQKLLFIFFKKQHLSKEVIANRKFVSLDNLYLRPDCKELMRFDLKIFPGQ